MQLKSYWITAIACSFLMMPFQSFAQEKLPDDIRYTLEDMYGAEKSKWPQNRISKDLNGNGYTDWMIYGKCKNESVCVVDIYLCIPDSTGKCIEYCYMEAKGLDKVDAVVKKGRCKSTC